MQPKQNNIYDKNQISIQHDFIHTYEIIKSLTSFQELEELCDLGLSACNLSHYIIAIKEKDNSWFHIQSNSISHSTNEFLNNLSNQILYNKNELIFIDENYSSSPSPINNLYFSCGIQILDPESQKSLGSLLFFNSEQKKIQSIQIEKLQKTQKIFNRLIEKYVQFYKINNIKDQLEEAQRIAKIGSWKFEFDTQNQTWTKEHYRIFEIEEPQTQQNLYNLYRSRIHPDDLVQLDAIIENAKLTKENFVYNHRVSLDNGQRIKYVQGMGKIITNSDGSIKIITGTCQDITDKVLVEKKLSEQRFIATQNAKMASLGEMYAGISHEVNNPLTIIKTSLEILKKQIHDPVKIKNKIETIEKAIFRISKIISALKIFSKTSEKNEKQVFCLNDLIKNSLIFLESKADFSSTELKCIFSNSIMFNCNKTEIEQLIFNFVSNSIEAIKTIQNRWIEIHLFEDNSDIVLQIVDSGAPISVEIEEKIFQPFFTTKPIGEGTGLGLSVCKGILENHMASCKLNRSFKTTCFEIRFKKTNS